MFSIFELVNTTVRLNRSKPIAPAPRLQLYILVPQQDLGDCAFVVWPSTLAIYGQVRGASVAYTK